MKDHQEIKVNVKFNKTVNVRMLALLNEFLKSHQ